MENSNRETGKQYRVEEKTSKTSGVTAFILFIVLTCITALWILSLTSPTERIFSGPSWGWDIFICVILAGWWFKTWIDLEIYSSALISYTRISTRGKHVVVKTYPNPPWEPWNETEKKLNKTTVYYVDKNTITLDME